MLGSWTLFVASLAYQVQVTGKTQSVASRRTHGYVKLGCLSDWVDAACVTLQQFAGLLTGLVGRIASPTLAVDFPLLGKT